MRLTDYLREDLVIRGLAASDTRTAVEAIGEQLVRAGVAPDASEVVESLLRREEAHTTVLGEGVAVPHATLPHLTRMTLLVAVAEAPFSFGPPDTEQVDVLFVLLSPPEGEREHIKLLARICRLVRHPGYLEELRRAPTPEGVAETIRRVDAQHV